MTKTDFLKLIDDLRKIDRVCACQLRKVKELIFPALTDEQIFALEIRLSSTLGLKGVFFPRYTQCQYINGEQIIPDLVAILDSDLPEFEHISIHRDEISREHKERLAREASARNEEQILAEHNQ